MADNELAQAFDHLWMASEKRNWIPGRLGKINPDGSISLETGRPNFVYVRIGPEGNLATSMARNLGVPLKAHLPVRMRIEDGVLVIHSADYAGGLDSFQNGASTTYNVGRHTHALGSGLEYAVEAMRLAPGRVQWLQDLEVTIFPFRYFYSGAWETWEGGTIDLTAYKPAAGKWAWVLVGVDPATNTAVAAKGADQNTQGALTVGLIDAISFGPYIPCAAAQVSEADTVLSALSRWVDAHGWLGGTLHDLDHHGDVIITTPADNEVLAYDNASGDWINQTAAEAGLAVAGHTHALDDLGDVVVTTPADNEVLAYDNGTSTWINQTAAEADLATAGHTHNLALDDLSDVAITSAADGHILRRVSGAWTNGFNNRPNLGASQDVTISGGVASVASYPNNGFFNLRGESGAADDLDTLNGGNSGDVIVLTGANEAITIKDSTGNINLVSDRVLSSATDILVIFYTGTVWLEWTYSNL